jgi:hypothetical protein
MVSAENWNMLMDKLQWSMPLLVLLLLGYYKDTVC